MPKKTRRNPIGFDPLAWMKGEKSAAATAGDVPVKAPKTSAAVLREEPASTGAVPVNDFVRAESQPAAPAPANEIVVVLGESCVLAESRRLHEELRRALAENRRVVLDASRVRSIDTAGLQLLDIFVREAQTRRVVVEWRQPSGTVLRDAKTLGLAEKLRLPA